MNCGPQVDTEGLFSRSRGDYYTHQKAFIGIEITNNTPKAQDLKFLGMRHRHYNGLNSGIVFKNILGDTLFDDDSLTMLMNWIYSVGQVQVMGIGFHTSLTYGAFGSKKFGINQLHPHGQEEGYNINLGSYFDPAQLNHNVLKIDQMFMINFRTELLQTNVEPGEVLTIIFDLNPRNRDGLETTIEKAKQIYNKEKMRKIISIL